MEFGGKLRELTMALLAVAATALLVFFGNGLEPRWPLDVAGAAAGAAVRAAEFRVAGRTGGVCGDAARLPEFLELLCAFWVRRPVAWFANFGLMALLFAAGVLLMRALARRGAVWSAWLASAGVVGDV